MLKTRRIEDFDGPFNQLIADRMRELEFQSLEAFAEYAGIGYTTLYNLVLGRVSASGAPVKPSVDTLSKLSRALRRPLGELIYIAAPDGYGSPPTFKSGVPVEVPVFKSGIEPTAPHDLSFVNGAPEHTVVEARLGEYGHLLGYRISGFSMSAGDRPILNNDIVVVARAKEPVGGSPTMLVLQNGTVVCRMLDRGSGEDYWVSTDPLAHDIAPSVIRPLEVSKVIGPVIRTIRDVI